MTHRVIDGSTDGILEWRELKSRGVDRVPDTKDLKVRYIHCYYIQIFLFYSLFPRPNSRFTQLVWIQRVFLPFLTLVL